MGNTVYSVWDVVIYCDFWHNHKAVWPLEDVRPKHKGKIIRTTATYVFIEWKSEAIRYSHIYKKDRMTHDKCVRIKHKILSDVKNYTLIWWEDFDLLTEIIISVLNDNLNK
jgi:hypothetical protein